MGRTRKEHTCRFCGKPIPKGTPTDEIAVDAWGATVPHRHALGGHHGAFSRFGYRHYYHRDCWIYAEIVDGKERFTDPFWVLRGVTELTYFIHGREIVIPLTGSNGWNKAVQKYNRIVLAEEQLGIPLKRMEVLSHA